MNEEMRSAVAATFALTALSMAAALLLGLPLGFVLGYFDFPGRRLLRALFETLLALPTVVVGLFVYTLISSQGPLGGWRLLFTIWGMALGQTVLALPIVTALTASAIEGLDRRLPTTLATLGASGWRLALSCLWEGRFALLVAAMTAYGRVVAEVGVSMMLGGNIKWRTRTITTAITLETGKGDFALGIALGLVLLMFSFALNALLALTRRRAEIY
jgi:tungstate transport system permease protein